MWDGWWIEEGPHHYHLPLAASFGSRRIGKMGGRMQVLFEALQSRLGWARRQPRTPTHLLRKSRILNQSVDRLNTCSFLWENYVALRVTHVVKLNPIHNIRSSFMLAQALPKSRAHLWLLLVHIFVSRSWLRNSHEKASCCTNKS